MSLMLYLRRYSEALASSEIRYLLSIYSLLALRLLAEPARAREVYRVSST